MSSITAGKSFALTPGMALGDPFDYSTALGIKKWSESTKESLEMNCLMVKSPACACSWIDCKLAQKFWLESLVHGQWKRFLSKNASTVPRSTLH